MGNPISQRIEYFPVIGGFLDGLRVTFRGGLNCVIGARGTGKTTAVEFVSYALDALPSREHATDERKRIENLVKRNLNGGRIELGIRATDGTAYRVTRSLGDEPIVLDESGAPAAVNLKSGLFRAEIFSQNAVESIADRPLYQLDQAARRIDAVGQKVTGKMDVIAQKHREQELAFRSTIEKHKQAQQQAAERTELECRRNQLLARKQQQTETGQRISELYARRRDLLEQLSNLRDQRFAIRKAVEE